MNCRLCGNDNLVDVLRLDSFPKSAQFLPTEAEFEFDRGINLEILSCQWCGLVQLSNEPVDYYKQVITAANISIESKRKLKCRFKKLIDQFELVGKSALDVGCGTGGVVQILREMGLNAHGLEYSLQNIVDARNLGVPVSQGYIEECTLPNKSDFFVCLNFLEHQPRPVRFLRAIFDNITEDGCGYITVPNLNYLLRNGALHEFVADHLVYFTCETLEIALRLTGFDCLNLELINNKNDIAVTVKKRKKLQLDSQKRMLQNKMTTLRQFVTKATKLGERLAVWGAGHRSLALMSICDLSEISFVIDSAKFKQGRFSPLLHKKIIAPEEIEEYDIDKVLIMLPGDFSREAVDFLKNDHQKLGVYIFDDNEICKVW